MKSFFFWLVTAVALGVMIGRLVPIGFPEVVILWLALNGIYYGLWMKRPAKSRLVG